VADITIQLNKKMKQTIPIVLVVALLTSCSPQQPGAGFDTSPKEYPVYTLQTGAATIISAYPASLEGEQNIEIRPKVDGFIREIFVDEGAVVKKGQLLFKLHAPQYEQEMVSAAAMISSAEAAVNAARLQVNNILPLVKKAIVTHTALETAQYQLAEKEAALAQAKASLANARTNIGYTSIGSPVNGIVGAIPYKTGSLVSSQSPLALTTVSNIGKVYAYFSFDEKQLLGFFARYPGHTVEEKLKHFPPVTLLLTDGTEYPEKGRIAAVNGMIDKKTGSISFRATFPNPSGMLRSGGSATLQIPLELPDALLLPQKATFEMQGKKLVFVVDEKNRVSSREVQVTAAGNGGNYIVQAGVQRGDRVVTDGMDNLRDSMIIKPIQQQHVKEIY